VGLAKFWRRNNSQKTVRADVHAEKQEGWSWAMGVRPKGRALSRKWNDAVLHWKKTCNK